jgi:hypothetical protein
MPSPDLRIAIRRDDGGRIRWAPGPQYKVVDVKYGLGQSGETPCWDNGTRESRHASRLSTPK